MVLSPFPTSLPISIFTSGPFLKQGKLCNVNQSQKYLATSKRILELHDVGRHHHLRHFYNRAVVRASLKTDAASPADRHHPSQSFFYSFFFHTKETRSEAG